MANKVQKSKVLETIDPEPGMWLKGDVSRLLFLTILYLIQGVSFGFLMNTLPIMLKKNFDYTSIGIISFCSFPYNIKFLFSPIVDTKYFKMLGKRRSWIIPTQILAGVVMYYLADNIYSLIEEKRVYSITFAFGMIFFCCALQDISVDGWSVTMVKDENSSWAAATQMIGIKVGVFASTTLYLALNSTAFCNHYIFSTPQKDPLLNEANYLKTWSILIMFIAVYTLLMHSEHDDRIKVHEDDEVTSISEILKISVKLILNKNMLWMISFFCVEKMFSSFGHFVGRIYLLDELNYSQEKLSFLTLCFFPLNIIANLAVAKFGSERPLIFYYINQFLSLGASLLTINVVYANFDSLMEFSPFLLDCILFVLLLIIEFTQVSIFTTRFAFANKV